MTSQSQTQHVQSSTEASQPEPYGYDGAERGGATGPGTEEKVGGATSEGPVQSGGVGAESEPLNIPCTATWKGEQGGGEPEATRGAGAPAGSAGAKGFKGIVSGVHGAGEAIRGNLMQGVDQIFGHGEGAAKHQKIAQAGVEKMRGRGGSVGEGQGES